jgi:hypothetical protein
MNLEVLKPKTRETRTYMVLPGILDEWNYWTDTCDPQEFMNLCRAQGHPTIGAAVERGQREAPESIPALKAAEAAERESRQEALTVRASQNGHAHPLALGPAGDAAHHKRWMLYARRWRCRATRSLA